MSANPIQTPGKIIESIKIDGLTDIQNPSNAKVDIVFIHGVLEKEPCWTSPSGVFWPYTLLAPMIPDARIFSYAYTENISCSEGEHPKIDASAIDVVQGRLINDLAWKRSETESTKRPILFVAHCLGGVILESSILNACDDDTGKEVVSCIRGILLLGTPHFKEGLNSAAKEYFRYALGSEIAELSDESLPVQLPLLISTSQDFFSFKLKKQGIVEIKSFRANKGTAVNEALARLSEDPKPKPQLLNRNQLQLSQFVDKGDNDFKQVLQTLTGWLGKINQASKEHNSQEHEELKVDFSTSTNNGMQVGKNTAQLSGISWTTNRA